MPFEAGVAVFCQQGNRTQRPRSHAWPNALHALDLSIPGATDVVVVAAADGAVRRVVTGAQAGDEDPGGGFGNQVVIEHAGGFQTLYAHLASVDVEVGAHLRHGARIGTMGDTGKAGNPHLHFSLHRDAWPADGAPPTIPMHGLVTADLSRAGDLTLTTSLELTCADATISAAGHIYASENDVGAEPRFGAPDAALTAALTVGRDRIRAAIAEVSRVATLVQQLPERGAEETRRELEAHLAGHPDDPVALYWIAVISMRDLSDDARAASALAALEQIDSTDHPWMAPWVVVRRAQLAERAGDRVEAKRLWQRARALEKADPELAKMVADALARLR